MLGLSLVALGIARAGGFVAARLRPDARFQAIDGDPRASGLDALADAEAPDVPVGRRHSGGDVALVLWAWPDSEAMYADLVTLHPRSPFRADGLRSRRCVSRDRAGVSLRVLGDRPGRILALGSCSGQEIPAAPLFREDRFLVFLLTFGFVFLSTLLFSKHAFTNYFYFFNFVLVLKLAWSRIEDVRAARVADDILRPLRFGGVRLALACCGFDHADERFDLAECGGCGLVSLSPLLGPDELARYYDDAYYGGGASGKFTPVMEAGVRLANRARAAELVAEWKASRRAARGTPAPGRRPTAAACWTSAAAAATC